MLLGFKGRMRHFALVSECKPAYVRCSGRRVERANSSSNSKLSIHHCIFNHSLRVRGRLLGTSVSSDRRHIVPYSFLGVGAPEAVLVGVVALVLFGPKGLAQAAKGFGEALRSFAPTIREITDLSSDLKSTIEDEIGLNDLREELRTTLSVETGRTGKTTMARELSNLSNQEDPDIEAKRLESAKMAWGQVDEIGQGVGEEGNKPASQDLGSLSLEELEAEIRRRKAAES